MNLYEEILNFYQENKATYTKIRQEICTNINGRICHHNVKVLNILVNLLNIKTYLEIGVHNGASMSYVVRQNKNPIDCYGIDLFSHKLKRYQPDRISLKRAKSNIQANNTSNSKINIIQGNSTSQDTISQINHMQIDLLFIDGDHSYMGVKQDFENYIGLVKSDGIIVFDDCSRSWPGVKRFTNELSANIQLEKIGLIFQSEMIYRKL